MTRQAMEKALYDLNVDRRARELFGGDPEGFRGRYRLDDEEAHILMAKDVRALAANGANPMLVWGFWMTCGDDRRASTYLARMQGETDPAQTEGE